LIVTIISPVVWRDNLTACKIHPEKSQAVGLSMHANFVVE
jgi:imidazoleglycerol phosphate synthase glutamine amidotransferase subunit HisH